MKINWEVESLEIESESEQPTVQLDPTTGMPVPATETVITTEDYDKHDGPMFYNVSLFDFFVPRGATGPNVQKMSYVVHRAYRTLEDLLDNPNYNSGAVTIVDRCMGGKELLAEQGVQLYSILDAKDLGIYES
jgi:hypothetical protein